MGKALLHLKQSQELNPHLRQNSRTPLVGGSIFIVVVVVFISKVGSLFTTSVLILLLNPGFTIPGVVAHEVTDEILTRVVFHPVRDELLKEERKEDGTSCKLSTLEGEEILHWSYVQDAVEVNGA